MTRCRGFLFSRRCQEVFDLGKGATTNTQHLLKMKPQDSLSLTAYRIQIPRPSANTNTQMTHDTTIRHNERMME